MDTIKIFKDYCRKHQLEKVLKVFEDVWFSDEWIIGWVDLFRGRLSREGLQNTNNYSESGIRILEQEINTKNSYRSGLQHLFSSIVLNSIPRAESIVGSSPIVRNTKAEKTVLKRLERAKALPEDPVLIVDDKYEVLSSSGDYTYSCNLADDSCTCFFYFIQGKICKHFLKRLSRETNSFYKFNEHII